MNFIEFFFSQYFKYYAFQKHCQTYFNNKLVSKAISERLYFSTESFEFSMHSLIDQLLKKKLKQQRI